MGIHFIGAPLWGGLVILAALASAPALAAPTTVKCNPTPTKLKAIVSDDDASFSDSQTYANLPQAKVRFVQGGTVPSCVVVRFVAEAGAVGFAFAEVRAILDDVTEPLPPNVRFGVNHTSEVAGSYEFLFPSVAPGNHVLRMQFRSSNGESVFIVGHSTIVLHKP